MSDRQEKVVEKIVGLLESQAGHNDTLYTAIDLLIQEQKSTERRLGFLIYALGGAFVSLFLLTLFSVFPILQVAGQFVRNLNSIVSEFSPLLQFVLLPLFSIVGTILVTKLRQKGKQCD